MNETESRLPQGHSVLQCHSAVAENQPANKNRMTTELSNFAARLLPLLRDTARPVQEDGFNELALELFALQFQHNDAYRKICEARNLTPEIVNLWTQIPAVPAAAFKELGLTCLAPDERAAVFHSSGTMEQKPSRHFHNAESLKIYEASLLPWFLENVLPDFRFPISDFRLVCLTPPPAQAPHSSLVHMFETVRRKLGATETAFVGKLADDGGWTLDFAKIADLLSPRCQTPDTRPLLLLGTAFSFVHLLDFLAEKNLRFDLPAGSRVMETGGYKNRSRSMPKAELHALIAERLGVPPSRITCEYGMSELSSQAYDGIEIGVRPSPGAATLNMRASSDFQESPGSSIFHFPPWARARIISSETGNEVAEGGTGLIRVFDLANVFSVMAIQTEDLGIRRGDRFELVGRAQLAEPRGCSLMAV
jgi:hypothetical protein